MSATVEELKAWLNDIDQDCEIAIDDGGLTLIGVKPDKTIATYYELGGLVYVECQNCVWKGDESELREIKDLTQRVDPGEEMPAGECPKCGCLCHEVRP